MADSSSGERIRILQVVGGMNRAGIETWLMRVLRNIDRERFSMDFVVHTTEKGAYDDEVHALGGKIIHCLNPAFPWVYAKSFRDILKRYGPYDIVHSQMYLFSGLVLRMAKQCEVPIRIAHMHPLRDVYGYRLGRSIYRRMMNKWIERSATCVLAPSVNSLESFRAVCDCSDKKVDIIHNCLDLDSFTKPVKRNDIRKEYGLPSDKPVITYVARFYPHKNHEQIIRVANIINSRAVRAHFVMVGSHGELLNSLRSGIAGRSDISLLVGIKDISRLLLASDLFFFPSLEEGFGVVAIEAAAAGLPVVATDIPTIHEALAPSHRPFTFPANDDHKAAENIASILDNEPLRSELARDAREWASQFTIEQSVNKLVSVYETCLASLHEG